MSISSIVKAAFAASALLLPGYILVLALFRERISGWPRLGLGFGSGLVILINLNVLLSLFWGIGRSSLIVGLVLLYLGSCALLVKRKALLRKPTIGSVKSPGNLILTAAIGWSFLIRLLPLFFSEYPPGWDSSFHSLIAKIISLTGHIPRTWQPFERIPLNYPWGSHVLINDVSILSGVEIHQSFAILNSVFFGVLSVIAVYALATRFFENRQAAAMAAFAYGVLANWGSLNYFAWGGLPNQIGMFLFLGVTYVLLEDKLKHWEKALFAGFLLSGIILVHNHAMLVSFGILGFYVLVVFLAQRKISSDIKIILSAGAIAILFSSYYIYQLVEKIFSAETSGVFMFKENLSVFDLPIYVGIVLAIFFVVGAVSYQRKEGHNYLYLLSWEVSLFFAFTVFHYVWKLVSTALTGEPYVAFTPSRFVTDLAYPVSIMAGQGIAVVSEAMRRYSVFLVPIFFLLLGLVPFYYTVGFYRQVLSPEAAAALAWVKENTPRQSLVVNNSTDSTAEARPENFWAAYVSERETTFTPLPTTDLPDSRIFEIKYKLPVFFLRDIGWDAFPKEKYVEQLGSQPVYFLSSEMISNQYFSLAFSNKDSYVYEVDVPGLLR